MSNETEKILLIYESNLNQLTAEHQKLHTEMQKTDTKAKATADVMSASFSKVSSVLGDVKKEAASVASEFQSGLGALAVAAAIAGVVKVCTDLIQSFKDVTKQTDTVTEAFERSKKSITDNSNRIAEGYYKIQQAVGNLSKKEAEAGILSVKNSQERKDRIQQFSNDYIKLADEIGISVDRINKKIGFTRGVDPNEINKIKRFNLELAKLQTDFQKDLRILTARQISDDAVLRTQDAAKKLDQIKDQHDKEEKLRLRLLKSELDKLKATNKKFAEDNSLIPIYIGTDKQVADIKKKNQKSIEDELKASQERITNNYKASLDEQVEAARQAAEKQKKIDQAKADIQQEGVNLIIQSLGLLRQVNEKRTDEELTEAQKRSDNEIEKFDTQLKRKEISQEEYDTFVRQENKKLENEQRELNRKAFERSKSISEIEAVINGALAVTKALASAPPPYNLVLAGIAAAAAAVQIALIENQPEPKFAKGVVGFQGKGTETSDSNRVWISKDESIITAKGTKRTKPLLEAINKGNEMAFIEEMYIAPALRKQILKIEQQKEKSFAQNIANSTIFNSQFKDGRLLDSLKRSRQNDKEIGRYIVEGIKRAIPNYNARKN